MEFVLNADLEDLFQSRERHRPVAPSYSATQQLPLSAREYSPYLARRDYEDACIHTGRQRRRDNVCTDLPILYPIAEISHLHWIKQDPILLEHASYAYKNRSTKLFSDWSLYKNTLELIVKRKISPFHVQNSIYNLL